MRPLRPAHLFFAAALAVTGGLAVASSLPGLIERPASATGTVVVPDRFLRTWDPITVFYASDRGRAGPEDRPERHVTLTPDHPGQWTWIDGRTLQFRPIEPWPALGRTTVDAGGERFDLVTLGTAPSATDPANGADGLDPVGSITLVFAHDIDPASLERMLEIELRPLPGLDEAPARWLDRDDFVIKPLDAVPLDVTSTSAAYGAAPSRSRSDDTGYQAEEPELPEDERAAYELRLDEPIPYGMRAIVHFRLTADADDEGFADVVFSTAEPFRVRGLGCAARTLPVTPRGSIYADEQAISCGGASPAVVVDFSARPAGFGPIEARNFVRFEPAVEGLEYSVSGSRVSVTGRFKPDAVYRVRIEPTRLLDDHGRDLDLRAASEVALFFPRREPFVAWGASTGILEREGPQMVPMSARGYGRADLRLVAIDPLDRSFFPFPSTPVAVDESGRPPGPGEELGAWTEPDPIDPGGIGARIRELTPARSALVDLPTGDGPAASFGLDLEPHLDTVAGPNRPGTYLVGVRALDAGTSRSWIRVQVTDLALTAVEEPDAVRFAVTSVSTGRPVSGADVRIDGLDRDAKETEASFETLTRARTDGEGFAVVRAADLPDHERFVGRVVVQKGDDVLVLDPNPGPPEYREGRWGTAAGDDGEGGGGWLQWVMDDPDERRPKPVILAHLFPERPVYRPEEVTHLKGWARRLEAGRLVPVTGDGTLVVRPAYGDSSEWTYPVKFSSEGGFWADFADAERPTGPYRAYLTTAAPSGEGTVSVGDATFLVDAYRLPTFEVTLTGPRQAASDAPFRVDLQAKAFSGGTMGDRPVRWRVTQYPLAWTPPSRPGFVFASDGRYGGVARFDATPEFEKEGKTDDRGSSKLVLDPTIEPTAQPRTYVVEATVTGDDDQTVTDVQRVSVVPAFALGLKVPRYVEGSTSIPVEILVADPEGKGVGGVPVEVRLLARTWHSHLIAGDYASSEPRYVTDVVDEVIAEKAVTSAAEPAPLALEVPKAGVYLVEVTARDRLGRAQAVKVDLYVGGDEPVAWEKPQAGTFTLSTDATAYDPGQTARIVLHSPFQEASALVIVEAPEGNRYDWVRVSGGAGTASLKIDDRMIPHVPVHVVLMRGRGPGGDAGGGADLGKPTTLAASALVAVRPTENQLQIAITAPDRAMPGDTVPVTVKVTDAHGKPRSGELCLWLVDAAVLSLGREARLDPVPDFIADVQARAVLRDTRNLAFGRVPFAEMPGGDGEEELAEEGPLPSVRRNFEPVPYWNPEIRVGPTGLVTVDVKLPDNLTVFKIRAKVASGQRFGAGTDEIAVRLPVLVEASLPRFVRPGDQLVAVATGRVIDGPGGAATATIAATGLSGDTKKSTTLDPTKGARVEFPLGVEPPKVGPDGAFAEPEVVVTTSVRRASDGAGDAVESRLPIVDDQERIALRGLGEVAGGGSFEVAAIPEAARPGSVRRSVAVAADPALLRVAAAVDRLGVPRASSTEGRISRARALLAVSRYREALALPDERVQEAVADALGGLPQYVDAQGLVADWPGGKGSVTRTAAALELLGEAREGGFEVDVALERTLIASLQRALRSDFGAFVDGESWYERSVALRSLSASGRFDAAYFAELARNAAFLDAEGLASVVLAGARGGEAPKPTVTTLAGTLSGYVLLQLHQGREIYGSLRSDRAPSPRIYPSEARAVATTTRALHRARPDDPKLRALVDRLVALGGPDGWGTENADAAALSALADLPFAKLPKAVEVSLGGQPLTLPADVPLATAVLDSGEALKITAPSGSPTLGVRADTSYVPAADGSLTRPVANGIVVTRRLEKLVPGGPTAKIDLGEGGASVALAQGDIVEDRVQITVPRTVYFLEIVVPLAAGVEALNPQLRTAPPEATPSQGPTRAPSYAMWRDDAIVWVYEELPKGTYELSFRARAQFRGSYVQPSARASATYDPTVNGRSAGARIVVE